MYLAGFTINVLTLVGLVLAIGLVCDDAIVVLENVFAKVERGRAPLEAAIEGSREIYFAVISNASNSIFPLCASKNPTVCVATNNALSLTCRTFTAVSVNVRVSLLKSRLSEQTTRPSLTGTATTSVPPSGWEF